MTRDHPFVASISNDNLRKCGGLAAVGDRGEMMVRCSAASFNFDNSAPRKLAGDDVGKHRSSSATWSPQTDCNGLYVAG